MDDVSSERFSAAAKQMEIEGFSDVETDDNPLSGQALQTLGKLHDSIRRLAVMIASGRRTETKS
jgi:hypothetical protein